MPESWWRRCNNESVDSRQSEDLSSHHITGTGKIIVEEALQGHPAHWPVFIISQAVIVHGEKVSSQCVICDLHLHAVINAIKHRTHRVSQVIQLIIINHSAGHAHKRSQLWMWSEGSGKISHLHTVSGSKVFMNDFSSCQVTHTTCNLDSHMNKILLGDSLHQEQEKKEQNLE